VYSGDFVLMALLLLILVPVLFQLFRLSVESPGCFFSSAIFSYRFRCRESIPCNSFNRDFETRL